MNLIMLTSEQADQVRGTNAAGTASLEPRETATPGQYILPARVLEDTSHSDMWGILSGLPVVDSSEVVFPVVEEE